MDDDEKRQLAKEANHLGRKRLHVAWMQAVCTIINLGISVLILHHILQ